MDNLAKKPQICLFTSQPDLIPLVLENKKTAENEAPRISETDETDKKEQIPQLQEVFNPPTPAPTPFNGDSTNVEQRVAALHGEPYIEDPASNDGHELDDSHSSYQVEQSDSDESSKSKPTQRKRKNRKIAPK